MDMPAAVSNPDFDPELDAGQRPSRQPGPGQHPRPDEHPGRDPAWNPDHGQARRPRTVLGRLREIDERRPDIPGEHLIALGAGAMMLLAGMRSRGLLRSAILTAAGAALVGRAASGTGGVARVARVVKRLG